MSRTLLENIENSKTTGSQVDGQQKIRLEKSEQDKNNPKINLEACSCRVYGIYRKRETRGVDS